MDSTKNKNLEFDQDFVIRHYAGDVVYNVNGFMDKNKDTLFQDFKRLLFNSKNEIYRYGIINLHDLSHEQENAQKFNVIDIIFSLRFRQIHVAGGFSFHPPDNKTSADGGNALQELHVIPDEALVREGALLHPLHQAQRVEESKPVQRAARHPSGQLSGSPRERPRPEGRFRLQTGVHVSRPWIASFFRHPGHELSSS